MEMKIKKCVFQSGLPVICVPVVKKTREEILEQICRMTEKKVPMIEWRLDWYEKGDQAESVTALLKEMESMLADTVLLCTFRSKEQGGEKEISKEAYEALNLAVAESHVADLVDVEYRQVTEPGQQIRKLQEQNVKVIASDHNFQNTQEQEELERLFTEMLLAGADFAKLAVMPGDKKDVLRLMSAVLSVKERYPDGHLIAMAMGKFGVVSRLLGGWYGSEVTFASFGMASAPGQVSYENTERLIWELQNCLGEQE